MEINTYKQKNGLDTQEKLLKHIDELKRNTVVNQELVNFLVDDFFAGEKSGTNSTRHKSRSGETHTVDCNPLGYRDVSKAGILELENPLEFPQLKSSSWSDLIADYADLLNSIEPNEDKETEEDKLIFHFRKEGLPHSDVVGLDSINEAEDYAKKNGYTEWSYLGLLSGFINEKDINPLYKAVSDDVISNSSRGVKTNESKPQMSLLFKQFPQALEAIVKCSEYGNTKYKETDSDFLNFQRVEGGSKVFADAGLRHRLEQGNDSESGLPHQYHVAWNALAELQIWIMENKR